MSPLFYSFTFAINWWHRKFRHCSVCQHSTINIVFSDNNKILIFNKFVFEGAHSKQVERRITAKSWTKRGVKKLLKKLRDTEHTKRYHTTTGFFQSHPNFIEENDCAFVCSNISNILLTHKYTQYTQLQAQMN